MLNNSYNKKEYIFPSGNKISYQGYENFAFNELIYKENISENDIITNRKFVPKIWYIDSNNKKHRHFVDIYIPSQNRCIEVKSIWTNQSKNYVLEKITNRLETQHKNMAVKSSKDYLRPKIFFIAVFLHA